MNDVVECVIEIPMGTKNKYEVNKEKNKIKLDRVLYSALSYPEEYGYIENTLSADGDPLDVLIISSYPTFPGCLVDARVLGYLKVIDNNLEDEKIIAVVDKDPRFKQLNNLEDIPSHQLIEIKDFFLNYKKLQNIDVKVTDFYKKEDALQLIEECKKRFEDN
jgi:inorganic pyrophosphatase